MRAHERRRPFDPDSRLVGDEADGEEVRVAATRRRRPAPRGRSRQLLRPVGANLLSSPSKKIFSSPAFLNPHPHPANRTLATRRLVCATCRTETQAEPTGPAVEHAMAGALRRDRRPARRLPRQLHRLVRGRRARRTASAPATRTRGWRPRASFITVVEARVRYRRAVALRRRRDESGRGCTELKSRGCTFTYEVAPRRTAALAAEGETHHLFLDASGRPRTVPDADRGGVPGVRRI